MTESCLAPAWRTDANQKQLHQQKMAEVVGGHRNLVALGRTLRLLELRLVHGCIADHGIQSLGQGIHRPAHTVEITQIHQHMLKALLGKVQIVGSSSGTLRTAVRRDHRPAPLHQGAGGIQAHT